GAKRVVQSVLASPHIGLAGIVRSLGQPDLEVAGSGAVHDVDAFEMMLDGFGADALVLMGERPELEVIVLEGVRVDGAQAHTEAARVGIQFGEVAQVPRDVESHLRSESGE